eukprot:scaffold127449_cov20-Tisochrysis_lutea.AAC.2
MPSKNGPTVYGAMPTAWKGCKVQKDEDVNGAMLKQIVAMCSIHTAYRGTEAPCARRFLWQPL